MEPTISSEARTTAKDFFLHLGAVIALYASVISLINLLFEIINTAFPDDLTYYHDPYSNTLRISVATLVILFPLYLILMRVINRSIENNPAKKDIGVHRWLTYLTLFLTGVAMIVDLIVLINTFLGGEITTRFTLKVLVVLAVTGLVFGYYLYELRAKEPKPSIRRMFRYGTVVIVLASIIGAFAYIGSPMSQRMKRFDQLRISDLQNIQGQVINYWQKKGELPRYIEDVEDSISGYEVPTDPKTEKRYEYSATGKRDFALCAVFELSTEESNRGMEKSRTPYYYDGLNWDHKKGKHCFDRTVDEDLYPVRVPKELPIY